MTRILLSTAMIMIISSQVAMAANRHVDIVNKTGLTLKHFYASSIGSNNWEEDILGRDTIANGETFDIDIDDGTGACRFDFRAVFQNGSEIIKRNINVCEISTFTYTR
ncbi:hypothetical protein [Methylobacterium sp. JK268]